MAGLPAGGARRGGGALRAVPPADLARVRVLGAELRLLADAVGELADGVVTALAVQPGASELDVLRWEAVSRACGRAPRRKCWRSALAGCGRGSRLTVLLVAGQFSMATS